MAVSGDAHERHVYFDSVVAELHTGLQDPSVQYRLGSLATHHMQMLDRIFLLNHRDGVFTLPKNELSTDNIPIAIVKPGERVRLSQSFYTQSSIQRRETAAQMQTWGPTSSSVISDDMKDIEKAWQQYSQHEVPYVISVSDKLGGFYDGRYLAMRASEDKYRFLGNDNRITVSGRLLVALVLSNTGNNPLPSGSLLHEAIHVDESEKIPILPFDKQEFDDLKLRGELEAYCKEWYYSWGLYESSSSQFAGDKRLFAGPMQAIERLRQRYLEGREDQFEPVAPLKEAIHAMGLYKTFDRPPIDFYPHASFGRV